MITGVLSTSHGGTGRTDGMVEDIWLSEYNKSAKELGQIGEFKILGNSTDLNSLTTPGRYVIWIPDVATANTIHSPFQGTNIQIEIVKSSAYILQKVYSTSGTFQAKRHYIINTNQWTKWNYIDYLGSDVIITISKDGDDTNSGVFTAAPVATVARAIEIASKLDCTGNIIFRFGPGDWGTVNLYGNTISAKQIRVENNDTNEFPSFDTLSLCQGTYTVKNLKVKTLNYYSALEYGLDGTIDIGSLGIYNNSFVYFNNPITFRDYGITNSYNLISVGTSSSFWINKNITLDQSIPNNATVLLFAYTSSTVRFDSATTFTGSFTGKKYEFSGNVYTNFDPETRLPGTLAGSGAHINNSNPVNAVLTYGDQEISGVKTLSYNNLGHRHFNIKNSIIDKDNYNIAQSVHNEILWLDKDGDNVSSIGAYFLTNGYICTVLNSFGNDSSSSAGLTACAPLLSGTPYISCTGLLQPSTDNSQSLGTANNRWSQLFAGTATISTSDSRVKTSINNIPDAVLDAWEEVNFQQYQFTDAVEEKGTDKARLHTGTIAQNILNIFSKHNLDATKYGLLCHDSWDAEDYDETIIDKEAVKEIRIVIDKPAKYETRVIIDSPEYTDEEGVKHEAITHEEEYEIEPEQTHEEEVIIEPEVSHVEHHHRDAGDLYSLRYEELFAIEAAYQRRRADRLEARISALEKKVK